MSWNIKCPIWGNGLSLDYSGYLSHYICNCCYRYYCSTYHETVCCDGTGCENCNARDEDFGNGCEYGYDRECEGEGYYKGR